MARILTQPATSDETATDKPSGAAPPRSFPRSAGLLARRALGRLFPRWLRWTALVVAVGLVFRRAIAWLAVTTLGATLHLIGINAHLPSVTFGWPWQSASSGKTTSTLVGPWVLQKIEGISRPALGTENFNFLYTHKVDKSIGPWPCWYSATFYAVGHASATVDLNPGPSWWKPGAGHYQLSVLRAPGDGRDGRVSVTMTLPDPRLPQTIHDVTIDDTLSKPVSTSHSWTYPGLGCGALLKPQFNQSVVYSGAQREAFDRVRNVSSVTRPLISAAKSEATTMVRDNFVQPTLNALGYTLASFTIRWVPGS
ncbi:MAG: hypothetical protein J2P25_17135 [Nocardiopsaceae bacterium]|nr:hypothetical protein [Nocardiopsaceae bacterium]